MIVLPHRGYVTPRRSPSTPPPPQGDDHDGLLQEHEGRDVRPGHGRDDDADAGDVDAVNAQGQEYRRLAQVGRSGNAVITSATDSGERAAGNTVADLELQVTPEGGDSYPVTLRYIIAGTDLGPYAPGSSYSVKIDPENPQNVTFG